MAAGDVKLVYAASANQTVTNLNSLASNQTWIAGWESALIDNTTNLYLDYRVTAQLTITSSNNQAGELRMYFVGMLDDSTWPAPFDGTESAETITDVEERDAFCRLGAVAVVDTSAGAVIYLDCPSVAQVFGGNLPAKFVLYISINSSTTTTAGLASSGNQVTIKGSYVNVAP